MKRRTVALCGLSALLILCGLLWPSALHAVVNQVNGQVNADVHSSDVE